MGFMMRRKSYIECRGALLYESHFIIDKRVQMVLLLVVVFKNMPEHCAVQPLVANRAGETF